VLYSVIVPVGHVVADIPMTVITGTEPETLMYNVYDIYNRLAMLRVAGREIEIFFSLQHKSRPEAFSFPQFFMELFRHQCYNKSAQSFTLFCVQTG